MLHGFVLVVEKTGMYRATCLCGWFDVEEGPLTITSRDAWQEHFDEALLQQIDYVLEEDDDE